jgi:hypothetical protein
MAQGDYRQFDKSHINEDRAEQRSGTVSGPISLGQSVPREREVPNMLSRLESVVGRISEAVERLGDRVSSVSAEKPTPGVLKTNSAPTCTRVGNELNSAVESLSASCERLNDIMGNLEI